MELKLFAPFAQRAPNVRRYADADGPLVLEAPFLFRIVECWSAFERHIVEFIIRGVQSEDEAVVQTAGRVGMKKVLELILDDTANYRERGVEIRLLASRHPHFEPRFVPGRAKDEG